MIPKLLVLAAAIACTFVAGKAQANGVDPTVVSGQARFSALGTSFNITNSPGAIINWHGFSIGAGETTRFIQQSAASSVLNRVVGPDPSFILGTLTSNGRVFLINPSGILVGQGAHIDVAGLVASTLNLSNQDFLAGRLNFTPNLLSGKVENLGTITTPSGGSVYLVGSTVSNSGIINSPRGDVILAAGQSVKIFDSSTPGVRVELTASDNAAVNLGEILAQCGQIGIYGAALRNAGIINADQVGRDASGKIVLRGKQDVTLDAGRDASGNFIGRVDFSGAGTLSIGGATYIVINSLGAAVDATTAANPPTLQGMAATASLAGKYALGSNIDATTTSTWNGGAGFTPIGIAGTPFTGTFDGLGHTITALTIEPRSASAGLFGATGPNLTFRNVGLVGGSVIGAAGTGGLIGTNGTGSAVSNSYNTGSVIGAAGTGGLVGDNTTGAITDSYATGKVSGAAGTGGLVGTSTTGAISNSYATGIVIGSGAGTGGLVGTNTTGTVSKSYASGSVTGTGAATGGLLGTTGANTVSDSYATGNVWGGGAGVGGLIGTSAGTVTTSYSTGSVSGTGSGFGALVGGGGGAVTTSFWNSNTSIVGTSVGGGLGMSTAEMTTQANYTSATTANSGVNPNWDFSNTWAMYDGLTNPLLRPFMTPLTVTANNDSKTYSGIAYSSGNGVSPTPSGNLLGTVSYSGNSQTAKNAGSYVITPSGLYSNQQGYIISYADGTLNIAKKGVTIAGTAANTKVYSGDTLATLSNIGSVATGISGEALVLNGPIAANINFNDPNVLLANTVTGTGYSIANGVGGLASNYALTSTSATAAANITTKGVTIAGTLANNKVYSGDTLATLASIGAVTTGVGTETLVLSGPSAGNINFDTKNAGTGKTVTATGYGLADGALGGLASNYALSSTSATAPAGITPAALAAVANQQSKLFGTSDPALTFSITGLVNNPALGIADTTGSVLSGALTRIPGESASGGPYAITQGSLLANSNYTLGFTPNNLIITGAPVDTVSGFNPVQIGSSGVITTETYYRPGNVWHISLDQNNADRGFDVMRGATDLNSRLKRSLPSCGSVSWGGGL